MRTVFGFNEVAPLFCTVNCIVTGVPDSGFVGVAVMLVMVTVVSSGVSGSCGCTWMVAGSEQVSSIQA